jgi:hypothetical protein
MLALSGNKAGLTFSGLDIATLSLPTRIPPNDICSSLIFLPSRNFQDTLLAYQRR